MMKRALMAAAVMLYSSSAVAGKTEREYMKNEVEPAVKAAEREFRASCGCALKIAVKEDSIRSGDDLYQAKHIAAAITEGAPKYCTDDASKKAICQMKTLEIVKGAETKFTFTRGKGSSVTDGNSYASWDMMTSELDK